jgi:hypothetical protein
LEVGDRLIFVTDGMLERDAAEPRRGGRALAAAAV